MKIKIFILEFLLILPVFSQGINFDSPYNIRLFADYLFCDNDYLRAAEEYTRYLNIVENDTVRFKTALAYSRITDFNSSLNSLDLIKETSAYYKAATDEKLKILFIQNDDSIFYEFANKIGFAELRYLKLYNSYQLLYNNNLMEKEKFLSPFNIEEKAALEKFYYQKSNPDYKSQYWAGILSAIIPGSGKIYTEDYGDGITAFLLTGVFSYLAYTNFDHKHYTRAWIFTAFGAGFYAGNVYGSVAAAQIFNAKVRFNLEDGIKMYLEENKYFMPQYEFCN